MVWNVTPNHWNITPHQEGEADEHHTDEQGSESRSAEAPVHHRAITVVVCVALAAVVSAMSSLNVALPGHRPQHPRR